MKKILPKTAVLIPAEAEKVFEGIIYDVYHWQQKRFDNSFAPFEMLKRADTVTAICVVEDTIVVILDKQPNRGSRQSFPGGRVDNSDTSLLAAAQREVLEETGYSFANWKLVRVWQPQTKIEWFIHLFVASDVVEKVDAHLDAGEKIEVQLRTFEEVKQLCEQNAGYLGEAKEVFGGIHELSDLLALPAFVGQELER